MGRGRNTGGGGGERRGREVEIQARVVSTVEK